MPANKKSSSAIVYFDLETGGLSPEHPDIQIAAIAVVDAHEVASFEHKIQFRLEEADPTALEINSWDWNTWALEEQTEDRVVRYFTTFLEPFRCIEKVSKRGQRYKVAQLAGHNAAAFDGPRLRAMFKRHDQFLPADHRVLDTMQLAFWMFPDLRGYSLTSLAQHFGICTEGAHDALVDVRMTADLARTLTSFLP